MRFALYRQHARQRHAQSAAADATPPPAAAPRPQRGETRRAESRETGPREHGPRETGPREPEPRCREISLGGNEGLRTVQLRQASVVWRQRRTAPPDAAQHAAAADAPAAGAGRRALLTMRQPQAAAGEAPANAAFHGLRLHAPRRD